MEILNQIKEAISTTKPIFENSSLDSFLDISFKPNSDIGIVYDYIRNGMSGLMLDENLSDNEKVIKILDNIISKFFDKDINIQYQNLLSIFCQKLANQFIYSRNIIKNEIGPVVDEIRNVIEKKVEEEFKKKNLGNLLSGDISLTTDQFKLFDWEGIKAPSSINNIITSVSNYLKTNSDIISRNNFDIAVNYILTKDLRENYLTLDKEELKDKLDSELVSNDYFDILINKDEAIKFFRKLKLQLSNFKTIRFNIVNIVTSMNDLKSYLDKIINDKDKIENNIYSKLLHNINILKLCINVVLYCCLFFKEIVFNESVLINKQIVNNSVFEKYKAQGLSLEDLAAYIRVYYLDKDLPFKGISVHNVLGANIQDELTKINNIILTKRKIYLKEFINKIFESVMIDEFEYFYKKFNNLIDEFSIKHLDDELKYNLIKEKYMKKLNYYKKHLYNDLTNVEIMIYLTIIETFFENSLIDLIFDIFNINLENIINQLKDNNDTNISDILESSYIDVYIELIIYFLKKFFIKIN